MRRHDGNVFAQIGVKTSDERCALEISGRYDQWILTLSGGALAISLAFLEKIAVKPAASTLFLLGWAWVGLIVAMLSALIAILFSQYGLHRRTELIDAEYKAFCESQVSGNSAIGVCNSNFMVRIADKLNWVSVLAFVVGVGFLCRFAFANLPSEKSVPSHAPTTNVNISAASFALSFTNSAQTSTNP